MDYELQDFRKDVIDASETIPVVIDFWAAWCGPCRVLGPVIEKLAGEAKGKWKLVKIDTEKYPEIASQFGVRGIPSVKMVYQRAIIGEFQGAQPEQAVRRWLQENLPSNGQEDEIGWEDKLGSLLENGDRDQARALLENTLKKEAGNADLKAHLAMLYLPSKYDQAQTMVSDLGEETKYEIEIQAIQTVGHLIEVAKGDAPVKSDVPNLGEIYRKGAISLIKSEFEPALESFLECLMKDKSIDDDGARKACIAIFSMLGNEHPLTQKYRRRFSMALY